MRTLYRNGRIYTRSVRDATALLVDGTQVAWLGDEDSAAGLSADHTVDVSGALITPAFVDAHLHATATGLALTGLDLSGADSLSKALDAIERHARAIGGRPILGGGWDETNWPERRPPTVEELDRAAYGGAVYLARVDAHSAVVSSALLASAPTLRSLSGYQPNGLLTRAAHDAARVAAYGTLSPADTRRAQRAARRRAAELGIGALHEMAGPEVSSADDLASLLALAAAEPGPEVVGYWAELLGIEAAQDLGAVGCGGDLFCDGSLGSHTAALHEPYTDRPDTVGELRYSVEELAEHILRCTQAGLQAGFHAIGDAAVDGVVAAAELAEHRRNGATPAGRVAAAGHRVEHVEMVTDPSRFATAGLIASMQPAFDARWGGEEGMYAQRLGPKRAEGLNRFAELAAAGVPLAFGSDSPVTPLDPWGAVRAAAYPHHAAWAISARSAFAAHTRGGWRAARRDGDGSGVLSLGAPATFAVWEAGEIAVDAPDERVARWSTDPRAAVPGLPDLSPEAPLPRCLRTVVRGEIVFDSLG